MKNKTFKLGQRVAVYENGERIICRIQEIYEGDSTIVKVNAGGDGTWQYRVVHVNQVRKFKKDPTKEIYIWDPNVLKLNSKFMGGTSVEAHVSNNPIMESESWVKYVRVGK